MKKLILISFTTILFTILTQAHGNTQYSLDRTSVKSDRVITGVKICYRANPDRSSEAPRGHKVEQLTSQLPEYINGKL